VRIDEARVPVTVQVTPHRRGALDPLAAARVDIEWCMRWLRQLEPSADTPYGLNPTTDDHVPI
jgi:hypothetical protein